MVLVTLGDGTLYHIDCENAQVAKEVVEYKLRQRSDIRRVQSAKHVWGVGLNPTLKTYNSGNARDGKPLICVRGWSYRTQG